MIAFFFAESIDQEKHFLINQLSGSLFQIIYINVNNFYIFSHYLKEKSCSMNCLNKVPYIGINAVLRKKNTQNSSQHFLMQRMRAWSMQINPKQTLQWCLLIGYEGEIGRQIFKSLVVKHVMLSFGGNDNHWAFYLPIRMF